MIHRKSMMTHRVAWAATVILVAGMLGGSPAWADDMILNDTSDPSYTAYGWTFLGLTLVSAAIASQSITDSQDSLDKANASFKQYKAATTEEDATAFRDQTEKHHEDAQTAEVRANLALLLTIVFGATSYFSFSPDSGPVLSVQPDSTSLIWRVRF